MQINLNPAGGNGFSLQGTALTRLSVRTANDGSKHQVAIREVCEEVIPQ